MYFVYFLKSQKNGKIYVGYTSKLPDQRLKDHEIGTNKWTKENAPVILIYYEKYHCKKDAIVRERFYKTGFGREIKKLIVERIEDIKAGAVSAKG
ncbi:GIY-YIG nuclease family protein [Patescibacteria group bacterium]|nr:GIY-YIG nuclease family protein [Patescibacteria group bacterium]